MLLKTSNREGWGIDVLEANACLTPAVGWRVPGTQDSIQDQKTGFIVPFGDVAGLARETVKILRDHDLRGRLAGESRIFCRNFTWDKSSSEIEKILLGLLAA